MHLEPVAGVVAMNVRRPPCACIAQLLLDGPVDDLGELVLVERQPEVVDAGSPQWPGWTTTLTAPRSSSVNLSLKPISSSSSHETPGSNDWYSSPMRPCRATSSNASLPMYRASTSRTREVTRW